jgi:hypothetical protein
MANTITLTGVAVNPSQKVTVPAQTVKVTIPSQTVNVTIAAQTVNVPDSNDVVTFTLDLQSLATALLPYLTVNTNTVSNTTNTNTTNTVVTSNSTFWVYRNGQFNWAGDFSFNTGPINYSDTTGQPIDGPADIAVPINGPWGGWQPFAQGANFNTTPYKYLTYTVKPTQANAIFATGFDANNDVTDGNSVVVAAPGLTKYGPEPQVGQWATYKIPLADFGFTNTSVLKFTIADGTGVPTNLFYVNDVGFTVS